MRSEAITVGFRISGAESVKNKYFEAGLEKRFNGLMSLHKTLGHASG
jgi:hypothetical protein